jgi:hypothetical protein
MDTTPNLNLALLANKQALRSTFHDDALKDLDTLVMLAVIDRDLSSPPVSPADGDRYLVKPTGSGDPAWVDDHVVVYMAGGWRGYAPRLGWTCYVCDEHVLLAWNGSAWEPALDVLGGVSELQNLTLLGVGTEADATNPLSAKLNNVLWAAKTEAEGGDGTLRYKLSKESAAKTLSLLFQDDFEGRAEIGLTGDDDFHFKVSADGETWLDAIVIDHETGEVSLPQTPPAGAPADLDIVLAGLALGLADALNSATFLGASGNRFADSFDTLDYVDAVGATNLETGVAGQLRPAMNGIDLSYRTNLSSTSDLTTYTFSSVSLGAAAADRIIAVGVTGTAAAGANRTVSSVTIGGVSATKRAAAGEAANSPASIWAAVVPTGTTGDIAVTWDNAMVRCAGEVWRMTGAVETPLDSDALATGDPMNLAVDVAAGGAVLGFACNQSGSGPGGYGWTGLTGDHDATVETNTEYSGASQSIASGQSGYAVVADPGAAVGDVRAAVVSYEPAGGLLNMVVASEILTAASAPDDAKIVARIEQIDPVTLGTDLIFEVSRDGGTSWTEADMNERFTVGGITVLESDAIDMSGQPSGTDMLWRITTDNGVMVAIDDIYLYWN